MARTVAERADVVAALAEVFREHGFAGASMTDISRRTGLGKGSLYHFFPDGKNEMAEAVLDDVSAWFETNVFAPLREEANVARAVKQTFGAVDHYFRSGKRICLVGAFALDETRDQFADRVNTYFTAWTEALTAALMRGGCTPAKARVAAEEVVAGIQGALVLARAQHDPQVFSRSIKRLQQRVEAQARGGRGA